MERVNRECLLTVSYAVWSVRFGHPNPGEKRDLFGTYPSFFPPNLNDAPPTSSKRRNEKPMTGSVGFLLFRFVTTRGRKQFPVDLLFLSSFSTRTGLPPSYPSRSGILFGPPFRAISHSFPCPSLGRWIRGKDGAHNNIIHKDKPQKHKQTQQKQPSSCNIVRTLEIVQRYLPKETKILYSHQRWCKTTDFGSHRTRSKGT